MRTVLVPLPQVDFDPTEVAVPWRALVAAGVQVRFATPTGAPGAADPRMVTGRDLGLLKGLLMADRHGVDAYAALVASPEFQDPLAYEGARPEAFDALLLPGGHAKGMCPYLESPVVQAMVAHFFDADKPVAAICHGTLLAARSVSPRTGRSVLHGRRTTGLTRMQELTAWNLTRAWLGDYYRTYPTPMETELRSFLRSPADYDPGPLPLRRDTPDNLGPGFIVRDGNYLSARWPGDAHRFAAAFVELVQRGG
ncbi:MAG: type 1 glutamine amidotransferase domain-containing protein [Pseudomonadota bacterium]|nr:type 1 glutamine amidotransferase domain-containing protein [Pseudomonadota bacterium]